MRCRDWLNVERSLQCKRQRVEDIVVVGFLGQGGVASLPSREPVLDICRKISSHGKGEEVRSSFLGRFGEEPWRLLGAWTRNLKSRYPLCMDNDDLLNPRRMVDGIPYAYGCKGSMFKQQSDSKIVPLAPASTYQ
jgi:hypothetical protein